MASQLYYDIARDGSGNIIPGATVTIFDAGTSTVSTIHSDSALTVAKDNPLTTDDEGEYEFYTGANTHKIRIEKTGYTTWERDNVPMLVVDHGELSGIADDDHTQYLLLAGRSGQSIVDTITVDDIKAKAPWYDVRAFGATGDGTTDDAAAIQLAIDAAETAGGGTVLFPVGIYGIESSLVLKRGVVLAGTYPGVTTSATTKGSTIKARANLTTMLETDLVNAREGMGLRDLLFDANEANFTVTTGVKLFGRKIRMENVDVLNGTGTGVHWVRTDFTPTPDQFCWLNWMTNCTVGGWDTLNVLAETTDSWFAGNYFSGGGGSRQKCTGGNAWIGNHFDNNSAGTAMTFMSDDRGTSGVLSPGSQIIGNYFDNNSVGLLFTSHDGSTQYESNYSVVGNRFRNNVTDLRIEDAINFSASDSRHLPGGSSASAILWDNCTQGVFSGIAMVNRTYTTLLSGRPANVTMRACYAGGSGITELRSERHGVATLPASATSVTVTHGLLGTPVAVQTSGISASAVFFVANVGATTFDIQVSASTGADRTIYWSASMSA